MKVVIVYHSADADGHFSGQVCKHAVLTSMTEHLENPDIVLIGADYQDLPQVAEDIIKDHQDADYVIVADLSFKAKEFIDLLNSMRQTTFMLIDHHKIEDVLEEVDKRLGVRLTNNWQDTDNDSLNVYLVVGTEKSAAWLCAEFFGILDISSPSQYLESGGEDYPGAKALAMVSLYDTWKHGDLPAILNFQLGLRAVGTDPANQDILLFDDYEESTLEEIAASGQVIKAMFDKSKEANKNSYTTGSITDGERDYSAVIKSNVGGSKAFDGCPVLDKVDVMIALNYRLPSKIWTVSVYSEKPGVDCSQICKYFGGGGHVGASGFQATTQQLVNMKLLA